MSEVMPNTPREFWSPPVAQPDAAAPPLAGACEDCGSEFMVGARFCHVCGTSRQIEVSPERGWDRVWALLRILEFHAIKAWFGLPTGSLVAFLIGLGCVLAAISVGMIYSVQTLADFQAIQLWRIEWLLAAVAAFVAGILLKRTESTGK
ncbi:MAG: hypothetical protein WB952_19815 [Terriglobales bacterium]